MTKCKNCGRCCIVYNYIKKEWVNCGYLSFDENGKSFCKIYKKRIGKYLGYGFRCTYRKLLPYDIPNCPYNTSKPIHPKYFR